MKSTKESYLWRFKWYILLFLLILFAVVLLSYFTTETAPDLALSLAKSLMVVLFMFVTVIVLFKSFMILKAIEDQNSVLEKVADAVEKNRIELEQINQNTRLSETAKTIAFREVDRQALRETVFERLHQQDFETTYEIIDELAYRSEYKDLAKTLKEQADKYRDATDQERENQVISHIDKLIGNHQWAAAGTQIERLIWSRPQSEKAENMRQKLLDKKLERKKILLTAWDDAVKRQDTDRSLEILKELDQYLTPNEGLALQEAARDIFRTKLHNLGVQFSLAVSEKRWNKAFEVGKEITQNFPNSRMAKEIHEKIEILQRNVQQQAG